MLSQGRCAPPVLPDIAAGVGGLARRRYRLALLGLTALLAVAAPMSAPSWTLLVFAPVAEEVVFRCGLQETLLRRLHGRRRAGAFAANALTALAFAVAHAAWHPAILAWLTVLPALAVGCLYQHRRQLVPCIAVHALFNATWLLGLKALN